MDMFTHIDIYSTRTMSRLRGSNMTKPAVVPGKTAAPKYIYLFVNKYLSLSLYIYIYIYIYISI